MIRLCPKYPPFSISRALVFFLLVLAFQTTLLAQTTPYLPPLQVITSPYPLAGGTESYRTGT